MRFPGQDVNTAKAEEKTDRIRAAERELAALRVASAEGFSMGDRLLGEIAMFEGEDLSRIENSRKNALTKLGVDQTALSQNAYTQSRLTSDKAASAMNVAWANAAAGVLENSGKAYGAYDAAKTSVKTSSNSATLGSGIQIGGSVGFKGDFKPPYNRY